VKKGDLEVALNEALDKLFDDPDDKEVVDERTKTAEVLNALLEYDIKKRKNAKVILETKFFEHFEKVD